MTMKWRVYTFYRNFIDPYEYSWKNGNSRWDLLDLVRACYALRPEGINWAYDDDGMPSFRLEKLTKANGIEHENAHDAMADVYATIAMAKLIKEKQPKLFQFFFEHRGKKGNWETDRHRWNDTIGARFGHARELSR